MVYLTINKTQRLAHDTGLFQCHTICINKTQIVVLMLFRFRFCVKLVVHKDLTILLCWRTLKGMRLSKSRGYKIINPDIQTEDELAVFDWLIGLRPTRPRLALLDSPEEIDAAVIMPTRKLESES